MMHLNLISRYTHHGSTGGTERYLLALAQQLRDPGQEVSFAWLASGRDDSSAFTDDHGFTVYHFDAPPGYVDMPPSSLAESYNKWLGTHPVNVVHFHTFSLSEAALAKVALDKGIPYVFTYHSPAWSCRRGDLLRWGRIVCDGEVRSWRCSVCMIQQRLGCSAALCYLATGLLAPFGLLGRFAGGKLHRRTAFIEDTARFGGALRAFLANAAAVVACAEWSIPVLRRNGAQPDRIVHCPQGVSMDYVKTFNDRNRDSTDRHEAFIMGYVGRVTPVKGVHILVEAFAATNYPDARLRIIGCGESASESKYLETLKRLAGDDPRIEFRGKFSFEQMLDEYRTLDVLAIPSVCLETGPLTLLEALAAGVVVWGSERIGQIAVLEEHGAVISPNTPSAWQNALNKAFAQHKLDEWRGLAEPVRVRTMNDVAEEMAQVYNDSFKASNYDNVR